MREINQVLKKGLKENMKSSVCMSQPINVDGWVVTQNVLFFFQCPKLSKSVKKFFCMVGGGRYN